MASFTPEQLYVPLDCGEATENRALAAELRHTGVNIVAGVNVIESLGLKPTLDMLGKYKYRSSLVDMHYRSVKADIENSLEKISRNLYDSVGFVTLSALDSMSSLNRAVNFNNGIQIALKLVDSDISEEEHKRRRGRTINEEVKSIIGDAQELGITALMGAGADIKLADGFTYFATGLRPSGGLEGCATFNDDQERVSDPIDVLTQNPSAQLVIGRVITRAAEPAHAVESIIDYINKG